jgi:hypothetical protein
MGVLFSIYNESLPPKSNFTVDQIPDLSGKVIIVTGATAGIGKETAKVGAELLCTTRLFLTRMTGTSSAQCQSVHRCEEPAESGSRDRGFENPNGEDCYISQPGSGGLEIGQGGYRGIPEQRAATACFIQQCVSMLSVFA